MYGCDMTSKHRSPLLVLSVDIDFFVDPKAKDDVPINSLKRLPSDGYCVDSIEKVQAFLEKRCCLSVQTPVPGDFIRHHVQGFDILRALHLANADGVQLVHVDAHADLGSGADYAYTYLLTNWLPSLAYKRCAPRRGISGLNLGNWVAFAGAAGFIQDLQFVPRNYTPTDLPIYYFSGWRRRTSENNKLLFCKLSENSLDSFIRCNNRAFLKQQLQKVVVPFRISHRRRFKLSRSPDYVFFCQSPGYTPVEADGILKIASRYIQQGTLNLKLTPPRRSRYL